MQSSMGQYSTQAGDPAHPVQHSVMTANSFGFFFRGVNSPLDLGSNLSSSGTIPAGFKESASAGMAQIIPYPAGFPSTPNAVIPKLGALQPSESLPRAKPRGISRAVFETNHRQKSQPPSVSFWPAFAHSFHPSGSKPSLFLIYWPSSP